MEGAGVSRRCAGNVVCYRAVLLLLWVSILLAPAPCQGETVKACPLGKENSPPVEVTLSCPAGEVVSLGEAVLGWNKYGQCGFFTAEDCKIKTDAFEALCEGRRNCSVVFKPTFLAGCGYTTFIIVSYDCHAALPTTLPPQLLSPSSSVVGGNVGGTSTKAPNQQIVDADARNADSDNIALIVGCVFAVVITVILLIIAIVLVIRRLACNSNQSEDDVEKKPTGCNVLPCTTNDNDHTNTAGDDNASNSGAGSDADRSQRKRKQRGRKSDKNQNMSRRLAPVGQEDEIENSGAGGSSGGGATATSASQRSLNKSTTAAASARSSGNGESQHEDLATTIASVVAKDKMNVGGGGGGGGGGGSTRSSNFSDPSHPPASHHHHAVKRHSSGARVASADVIHHDVIHRDAMGNRGSRHEELSRRRGGGERVDGGGENKGGGGGGGELGGEREVISRGHRTDSAGRSKHGAVKKHSDVKPAAGEEQSMAMTSKSAPKYDAVGLPNTETVTSC